MRDESAIASGRDASGPPDGGTAGARDGVRASRAADLLLPFRHLIGGDVLVAGPGADALAAVLRDPGQAGRVVVEGDPAGPARVDVLVALDPGDPARPLDEMLALARERLRPGGRLVLGLDNAAALGALTRHETGPRPPGRDAPPATTRAALAAGLAAMGLAHSDWWYPFPDRGCPHSLVAERGLDGASGFDAGALAGAAAAVAPGAAGLRQAWSRAHRAGLLAGLAPAFLVAASAAPLPPDPRLALHLGPRRRPGFDRLVTFTAQAGGVRVTRTPLDPGIPPVIDGVENLLPAEAYRPGRSWQGALETVLGVDGWGPDAVAAWARTWTDALGDAFAGGARLTADTRLPGRALDAIPKNLILTADGPHFIDLEWRLAAPLDAGHLLVRGLANALPDAVGGGLPLDPGLTLLDLLRLVPARLGIPLTEAEIGERLAREERFQATVSGRPVARGLAWAAGVGLSARAPGADEPAPDRALHRENQALRARLGLERAAHDAALAEAAARTDRVVAYAADLDRARVEAERARTRDALAEAQGLLARAEEVLRPRAPGRRTPLARLAQAWLPGRG